MICPAMVSGEFCPKKITMFFGFPAIEGNTAFETPEVMVG